MAKGRYQEWLTEDGLLQIEGWARDGLSDLQIATKKIGIGERTFTEWKARFPAIPAALKKGRAPIDVEVENALYKSAIGYYVEVNEPIKVKTRKQLAGKGLIEEEHIEMAKRQIYVQPQTAAQIFWLKNRRPDRWRDKPEASDTKTDSVKVVFDV